MWLLSWLFLCQTIRDLGVQASKFINMNILCNRLQVFGFGISSILDNIEDHINHRIWLLGYVNQL